MLAKTQPDMALRLAVFSQALLFVLGFSVVFVVGWGGAFTLAGQLFGVYKTLLGQLGGLVVLAFGLNTLGVFNLPWLGLDTRPALRTRRPGWAASLLMGVSFAAGWTPCIGTILSAILNLSLAAAGQAMLLSAGYALGLGLPFLLIGFGLDRAAGPLRRLSRYLRLIQIGSGLALIAMGVLMLSGRLTLIAAWAQQSGFYLDLPAGGAAVPSLAIAVAGGLLSFLSPCVLPLVPAYIGYLSGQAVGSAPQAGGHHQ